MAHTLRRSKSKYGRTRRQRKKQTRMRGGSIIDDLVSKFKPSTDAEKCAKAQQNVQETCNMESVATTNPPPPASPEEMNQSDATIIPPASLEGMNQSDATMLGDGNMSVPPPVTTEYETETPQILSDGNGDMSSAKRARMDNFDGNMSVPPPDYETQQMLSGDGDMSSAKRARMDNFGGGAKKSKKKNKKRSQSRRKKLKSRKHKK